MRRWFGMGGLVGVVGVLTAIACSNGSEPYPDAQSFCAARANAECQVASQCLASPSACTSDRQAACMQDANAATQSGHRVYNPAAAQACLDLVQAAFAPDPSTGQTAAIPATTPAGSMAPSIDAINTVCNAVFPGTIPQMGQCTTSSDCLASPDAGTSLICAPVAPGNPKMECTPPINVALGAPCGSFGSVCPIGAYCHGSAPAICKAGGQNGQACAAATPCGVGAFCDTSGHCKSGGAPGAACADSTNCGASAPYCDPNVPASGGGMGSCVPGLFSLGSSSDDCKAFGAGGTGM